MDESSDHPEIQTGSSIIPLVLALLALLVGGSGIYFGYTAAQNTQAIQDEIAAQSGKSLQSVSALEDQIEAVSGELKDIQNDLAAIKTRMKMDRDAQSRSLTQIAQELANNRDQINQNTRDIAEIPEQLVAPPPPVTVTQADPSPEPPPATDTPEPLPPGDDTEIFHTIAAGDTLARLASEYQVSLSQIQAANPTVDPRRLQIGQKIRIPRN